MESLILKVAIWIYNIWPAILGSAISIFLGKKKMQELTKLDIWITFFLGIGLGLLFGKFAVEYFDIKPKSGTAGAIYCVIAFMGMAALAEAQIQMPLAITSMRKKWFGE